MRKSRMSERSLDKLHRDRAEEALGAVKYQAIHMLRILEVPFDKKTIEGVIKSIDFEYKAVIEAGLSEADIDKMNKVVGL